MTATSPESTTPSTQAHDSPDGSLPARQEDYQITLEGFQGPLDLLFYLIRRAEVDIHDIPIAKITDQYLSVLKQVESIDVELAGEFLVMASTLIEIKSRSLAPEQKAGDGEDESGKKEAEDPRYELVRALLAYQRYRVASEEMDQQRKDFEMKFRRHPAKQQFHLDDEDDEQKPIELDDVHILDLAEAYERIASSIDFSRLGDHMVEYDDTPIELHEEDLMDRLERSVNAQIKLQDAFEGKKPMQRIGLFMATLELTRMRRIIVTQEDINTDINIEMIDDPDAIVIESDMINHRHDDDVVVSEAVSDSTAAEASPE